MTYQDAIEEFPDLAYYNLSELELLLKGAELRGQSSSVIPAIGVIIEHMEEALA